MRLIELGVEIVTARFLTAFDGGQVTTACKYTGRKVPLEGGGLVVVGARRPEDRLYRDLAARSEALAEAGIRSLQKIGDCDVPGAVVHAVFAGHKLAREFDAWPNDDLGFRLERAALQA